MSEYTKHGIYCSDEFSWFRNEHFNGRVWKFEAAKHRRCMKLTDKINERISIVPDIFEPVGQAAAVYKAQLWNEIERSYSQIIVKIFMR
jgi:hypothetical protein